MLQVKLMMVTLRNPMRRLVCTWTGLCAWEVVIFLVSEGLKTSADIPYVICIFQWLRAYQIYVRTASAIWRCLSWKKLSVQSRKLMNHLWRRLPFAHLPAPQRCRAGRKRRLFSKDLPRSLAAVCCSVFRGHLKCSKPIFVWVFFPCCL